MVFAVFAAAALMGQNAIVGDGFSSGWGNSCINPVDFSFLSPGINDSYILTTQANGTGDRYFRFGIDWSGTYKQLTVSPPADNQLSLGIKYTLNSTCTSSGAMYIDVTNITDSYVFKTLNAGANPTGDFVVFKVQGDVRTVTSVSQSPGSVEANDDVTVSANLNGSFAAGQSAFLRYTADNWATSTVVEMTGSATTYSAIIPSSFNGSGNTIRYYVFTSGAGLAIPGSDADLFTINYMNNGGSNYSYTLTSNVEVFDHFNRNSGNTVGIPSSGGPQHWTEYETTPLGARINGSSLWMGSTTSGRERISYDMTGLYPVAYDESTETMRWALNMHSNRDDPSGFNSNQYGSAVILGSNKADFTDSDAYGYAVVLGGGTRVAGERPLRLVRFTGGLVSNSNSNIEEIASIALMDDRSFLSVNVEYESCSRTWTLKAREETGFTQPSIGIFPLADTGIDTTYTSTEIPYLGVLWNHGITSGGESLRVDNIYIPKANIATDNVYTWTGGGSGNFNTPSNWSPHRNCARRRDVLIFNGGTSEVKEVPNQTIGQIRLLNNASVTLMDPSLGGNPSRLILTGGPDDELRIPAGSTLILDVVNTVAGNGIQLDMLANTTGVIAGTMRFGNTSSPPGGRPHQLLVTDQNAVLVKNGGRVEAVRLLSYFNPFGDDRATDAVIFESGSTYLHASGANPFGYGHPKSKVVFEPGSWYHFTASTLPAIAGRNFANFKYESATTNSTGSNDYRMDTLLVLQGKFNLNLDATATIAGDIEVAAGATLAFLPPSEGTIDINAPVVQNIYGSGTITIGGDATLNLQNTNRINIQKNMSILGVANLASDAVVDFQGENFFGGAGGTTNFKPNATVYLGAAAGISASGYTGNVRTGTRSFSGQTAYVYDGTTAQNTGTGLPTNLTGNGRLEIDNPGNTVTLTNTGTTTTPKLTLSNGLFAVGPTNNLAISNTGSVESTATGNFAAGSLGGTVIFKGAGNVNAEGDLDFWNVQLAAGSGGVNFGATGTETIHNEMVIKNGSWVDANAPFYAVNSTLVYNTSGNYTAGVEWDTSSTSGRGVPYHVEIGRQGVNNTKLNFGSSDAWRYCSGNVQIGDADGGSGYEFLLSNEPGGDLRMEGDFKIRAGGTFGPNQRAVFFLGSTDQTITSHVVGNAVEFDYLIVDKPGGDLLLDDSPGTTVYAQGTGGGNLLVLSGGDLDLQGQSFYLGGNAASKFLVSDGNQSVKSVMPANFHFIGAKEVTSTNSGALFFEDNVTVNISDGVNFGVNGLTIINATLQINPDGYANLNAPLYGPQGVLKYNTGATPYARRVEWSGTEGTPGYPNDVIVAGNTVLNPGGDPINPNTGTDFGARRDVIIESGSAIYMDYGSDDMTVPLKVGRNLTINGSLSASEVFEGDIHLGGDWVRNTGGVFYPKNRQVLFNGSSAQSITAAGGETFDYLAFDNEGVKTLNDNITVNENLDIYNASGALIPGTNTITLMGNWDNHAGTAAFDETGSTVIFAGSVAQSVNTVSASEDFHNLAMNNSGEGLQLDKTIGIFGLLTFTDGLIHTGSNRVDFYNGATNTNSGDASYVNGFVRKTGFTADVEFKFPVGQYDYTDPMNPIDVYQPAALLPTITSATASFTVDYQHDNYFPGTFDPTNLPDMLPPLAKVSTCDYWNIDRTTPGTDARVKLYWSDVCFDITDILSLVVAKVNGDQWESQGQSNVLATTPFDFGYVVSGVVSAFSPFAIGSTVGKNILPIELISFTAEAHNDVVETKWSTASESNNAFFTVERSVDAENFEKVGTVEGAGNSTVRLDYAFIDNAPYSGVSYYRLRQTDFDGGETYSVIRAVEIDGDLDFELLQVYRMQDGVRLNYRAHAAHLRVEVFDMLGKHLFSEWIENAGGGAVISPSLARGIYILRLGNGVDARMMKFFY